MKKLLPALMLTVTASVFGQSKDDVMKAVVDAVGANEQNGIYVEGEVIAAGVIRPSEVYTFTVHVPTIKPSKQKMKEAPARANALRDEIAKAFPSPLPLVTIRIQVERRFSRRVPTGEVTYSSRPIRITSWCTGNICTSTASGGIYEHQRTTIESHTAIDGLAVWQNY